MRIGGHSSSRVNDSTTHVKVFVRHIAAYRVTHLSFGTRFAHPNTVRLSEYVSSDSKGIAVRPKWIDSRMYELSPYRVRRPLYPSLTEHVDRIDSCTRSAGEPSLRDYWRVVGKDGLIIISLLPEVLVSAGAITARVNTPEAAVAPRATQVIGAPRRQDFHTTQIQEMLNSRTAAADTSVEERRGGADAKLVHPVYKRALQHQGKVEGEQLM